MDPEVRGETGGRGLNESFNYGAAAGRYSAQVTKRSSATQPDDLTA